MTKTLRIGGQFIIAEPERDLLGSGGMGEVYRATDTQTGGIVAIKALDPAVVARDPELLERFLREGEALRQLNHPNIVHMIAACEEAGLHYLVMEYVGGGSLEGLLRREGRLAPARAIEIALDLADALTRAHRLGIIHRDLKPANVLLAPDGTPRLADFGIAHVGGAHIGTGPQLTQTGMLIGTVDYLSPEACRGEALDERADIWAFGVLLFEMLAGRLPFSGANLTATLTAILTQPVPDLAHLVPGLPHELIDLVSRMLRKDLQARVTSARQVGLELETLQKGRPRVPGPPITPHMPPSVATPSAVVRTQTPYLQQSNPPVFVARERELSDLEKRLESAMAGQGQVTFVTGEAGQGKATLLQEFARRSQAAHRDLVVANGNCDAYTGIGDPYLPFRQILALLTGDVESPVAAQAMDAERAQRLEDLLPRAVQGIVEGSADLVDVFVPGEELLRRVEASPLWPDRDAWIARLTTIVERKRTTRGEQDIQQGALFEQYARLLRRASASRPLLLLLDDLQWADGGSCSLLFHIGKRIADSRIMVLDAYRPSDVASGRANQRHPLASVANDLCRLYGDNQLDLGQVDGRAFVDALLDSEPNQLNDEFRRELYALSQGLPLATVELLRDLRGRGGLVRDNAGRWVAGASLDWAVLPTRVEAMFAERIARLDDHERHVLQVASVEGETFTAELIARVIGAPERDIIKLLSEQLDQTHRLVRAEGVRRSAGQRLSVYRFRHILFQKYLYVTLDVVERAHLHDDVASALRVLHGLRRKLGSAGPGDVGAADRRSLLSAWRLPGGRTTPETRARSAGH